MAGKLARRFSIFYFLLFLPVGLQTPYLFLFFKRQGFADADLGTLAAVTPIMNMLAPPLWGVIADALGDRRRMLTILLVVGALTFPWLMWSSDFGTTLVLLAVFSAFAYAPAPIADAMALENLERAGGDYGRLRLWGSLGFAAPLLVLGLVLTPGSNRPANSLYPIFIAYAVTRLICAGWVRALPPSRGRGAWQLDWRGARVFATRGFVALAACTAAAQGAMSAYYLYFSIYLDRVGVADNLKGYYWVLAVVAEVGMMLVVGHVITRLGLKWTFVLGILGGTVRLFAFSFLLAPLGIAAAQLLHALTMTAFMVAGITFINRLTPPDLRATGQTLWAGLTMGLGSAAGSKLSGLAVTTWGLLPMYRSFSYVSLAALFAAIILIREPTSRNQTGLSEGMGNRNGAGGGQL